MLTPVIDKAVYLIDTGGYDIVWYLSCLDCHIRLYKNLEAAAPRCFEGTSCYYLCGFEFILERHLNELIPLP